MQSSSVTDSSNEAPQGSSFHFFEQFGVWAHEDSHNYKQDDKGCNPGMSNHVAESFQIIIPADLAERMKRRGSNWSNHFGAVFTNIQEISVSELFSMKIYSKRFQLRGDLAKFLSDSMKKQELLSHWVCLYLLTSLNIMTSVGTSLLPWQDLSFSQHLYGSLPNLGSEFKF